jgi:hypothetical protein
LSASTRPEHALRVVVAFGALVAVDVLMKLGGFRAVHRLVTRWRVRTRREADPATARALAAAVDSAARLYLKRAWCLQRSVVAACLLRSRGIPAELVIGVRKMPFLAHAWVELDGVVLNDRAEVQQVFAVMERCRP